jgi:outer membrane protein TolC
MIKNITALICLISCFEAHSKTYQLSDLIALVKLHPEVKIEKYQVDKALNLFNRIDGEALPKMTIISGLGPNRSSKGNALSSENSAKLDTITYVTSFEIKIPVFMFGRKSDLDRAADGNLKVAELDVLKKEAELISKVKEYYYGFQYASSLNEFVGSTIKDLDDVLKDMKEKKKTNSDEVTKLQLFRSLAQVKKIEIEKNMAQALLGLKYITQDDAPTIEQDWIEFTEKKIPSLEELKLNLSKTNIDLQKASIGLDAKTAFLSSEKKSQLPIFGIFSSFDYKKTPKSEKQISKFSYDPYNHSDFSVGVGLVWDIDFGVKKSNVNNAQIELETIKSQQAFAIKNLPIKIEKIYLDLEEAGKKVNELEKSYKISKKLLNNIATGVAFGLQPAKDIIESYTLKAQIYQQYVEAIYHYELRLSDLASEIGTDL